MVAADTVTICKTAGNQAYAIIVHELAAAKLLRRIKSTNWRGKTRH